jgi:hypothetical protein
VKDTIITTEGVYLRGLEVLGLDSEHTAGDVLVRAAEQLYEGAKTDIPEEALLQFMLIGHSNYADLWERFDAVPKSEHPLLNLQRDRRSAFLRSRRARRFSTYLFVGSMRAFTRREFAQLSAKAHAEKLEEAQRLAEGVTSFLGRGDIKTRSLREPEIAELVAQQASPDRRALHDVGEDTVEVVLPGVVRFLSRRERFFDAPISWTSDHVRIGSRFIKVLSLKALPDATHFTLTEAFLHLEGAFRLSVVLMVPNQNKVGQAIRVAHRISHADAHRGAHVQDAERTGRLKEQSVLAELLADTKQTLVLVGMQLVLSADSVQGLETRVREVTEHLRQYQLSFIEENGRHDIEYMKSLPGMAARFERWKLVPSNNAVDLMPVFGSCHGDRRPVLLVRTARGELFSYDPVEPRRDNWNATVFGASGAGKSVFMNVLITTAMLSNHTRGRLMIVDFAGETKSSYLMVARLFGGRFVPILSEDRTLSINPFPPRRLALRDGELQGEVLTFLVVLTDMLIVNTQQDKDAQLFRHIVSDAIVEAYKASDDPEYSPTYSDLVSVLSSKKRRKDVDAVRLSVIVSLLEGFLRSPEAALFNRRSSIDVSEDFLIFDLFGIDSLPPHVQQAVAYLVCHFVKRLAFDAEDAKTKYIVLDEVAQLLRRPEMTALVHELYSTARKHNTSVWTVTQKYSDYVASAVAGTINLNSTTQLFLSHARAAAVRKQIVEDFEMNEREQYLFEGLRTKKGEYSEALLRTEIFDPLRSEKRSISSKLKIELSPFDYEIATSDSADRELQRRYIEANPDVPLHRVLEAVAKKRAARGGERS